MKLKNFITFLEEEERLNNESDFSPLDYSNLALWLDGADSSTITISTGSSVSQWVDKSGNNKHATQATAASQPILVNNGVNNLPVLRFDGVNDGMDIPNISFSGGVSVFCVVKLNATNTINTILTKTSNNLPAPFDVYALSNSSRFQFAPSGALQNTSLGTTNFRLFGFDHNGTSGNYYFNGAADGTVTGQWSTDTGVVRLGTRQDGATRLNGDLAEVIAFNRVLTAAERAQIFDYLNKKYLVY